MAGNEVSVVLSKNEYLYLLNLSGVKNIIGTNIGFDKDTSPLQQLREGEKSLVEKGYTIKSNGMEILDSHLKLYFDVIANTRKLIAATRTEDGLRTDINCYICGDEWVSVEENRNNHKSVILTHFEDAESGSARLSECVAFDEEPEAGQCRVVLEYAAYEALMADIKQGEREKAEALLDRNIGYDEREDLLELFDDETGQSSVVFFNDVRGNLGSFYTLAYVRGKRFVWSICTGEGRDGSVMLSTHCNSDIERDIGRVLGDFMNIKLSCAEDNLFG
jgi:hypothetical protein